MTNEVAARIESVLAIQLEDIGEQYFHNMGCPVHVFRCRFDDAATRRKGRKRLDQGLQKLRCSIDDAVSYAASEEASERME
jgi:adenylate cyclase